MPAYGRFETAGQHVFAGLVLSFRGNRLIAKEFSTDHILIVIGLLAGSNANLYNQYRSLHKYRQTVNIVVNLQRRSASADRHDGWRMNAFCEKFTQAGDPPRFHVKGRGTA